MQRVNFHRALLFVLVGATALPMANPLLQAEPQPGELLELKVDTPNGPLVMRFRYCPSGQLLRGKPQALPTGNGLADKLKRQALLAEVKGFYVGETEVSQEQVKLALGEQAVERAFARMVLTEAAGGRGSEFPIRGVTPIEAAAFCKALHDLGRENPSEGSQIEARKFRLPTHDEWQYACRAIRDAGQTSLKPHFNVWPQLEDVPEDVIADCNDVWEKKIGENAPFDGSQVQVLRIIEAHDNPVRGVEILTAFLRLALGTKRNYASPETQPQPVGSGTKNAWNVFNMHGNVFEWTIAERNAGRVAVIWDSLASGDVAALSKDSSMAFFLAGGGYNHSLDRNVTDWRVFSTWGEQPMKDETAASYSIAELEEQNVVQDTSPGFRVLLDRVLAKDWLYVIRKSSVLHGGDDAPASIQQRLDDHRRVIRELASGDELAAAEAKIDFYEALAKYRQGKVSESAKLIDTSSPSLTTDDPFFSYVKDLLAADSR